MPGINTEEKTRSRMIQELLFNIQLMLPSDLITGWEIFYNHPVYIKTTFRKSAAWSGGNGNSINDQDDEDQFLKFGDSMYSDSGARSRASAQNSVSYTRNRAKITNIQAINVFSKYFYNAISELSWWEPIHNHNNNINNSIHNNNSIISGSEWSHEKQDESRGQQKRSQQQRSSQQTGTEEWRVRVWILV